MYKLTVNGRTLVNIIMLLHYVGLVQLALQMEKKCQGKRLHQPAADKEFSTGYFSFSWIV